MYACIASLVGVTVAYVIADTTLYMLLRFVTVAVACAVAFVGSAALCAVLLPVAG